jgi:hypothetical protein
VVERGSGSVDGRGFGADVRDQEVCDIDTLGCSANSPSAALDAAVGKASGLAVLEEGLGGQGQTSQVEN